MRLVLALLASSALMAALATGIAFVVYGSWEYEAQAVMDNTRNAAIVALSAFLVFNLTFGLASMLLLHRIGLGGALAHALSGVVAGLVFGLVSALLFATPIEPVVLLVLAITGALMLLLARAFLHVRRPAK